MRYGEQIGTIENGRYEPSALSCRFLDTSSVPSYILTDEGELDAYLRGAPIESTGEDGYILISYN